MFLVFIMYKYSTFMSIPVAGMHLNSIITQGISVHKCIYLVSHVESLRSIRVYSNHIQGPETSPRSGMSTLLAVVITS